MKINPIATMFLLSAIAMGNSRNAVSAFTSTTTTHQSFTTSRRSLYKITTRTLLSMNADEPGGKICSIIWEEYEAYA